MNILNKTYAVFISAISLAGIDYCHSSQGQDGLDDRPAKLYHAQKTIDSIFPPDVREKFDIVDIGATQVFLEYKAGAEAGNLNAISTLGFFLVQGIGCQKNNQNWTEGVRLLRIAAANKSTHAMVNLGHLLQRGLGFPINETNNKEAFDLYAKAAELNDVQAFKRLAYCFEEGVGCTKDLARALDYYGRSARGGDIQAMVAYASRLDQSVGCEDTLDNKRKAAEFYRKALLAKPTQDFTLDEKHAVILLSKCLIMLRFTYEDNQIDAVDMMKWLKKASNFDDELSMFSYASNLMMGIGCAQTVSNLQEAFSWMEKLAQTEKNTEAMEAYGLMLYKNIGCENTPKNKREGILWLKKAAAKGSVNAVNFLAELK